MDVFKLIFRKHITIPLSLPVRILVKLCKITFAAISQYTFLPVHFVHGNLMAPNTVPFPFSSQHWGSAKAVETLRISSDLQWSTSATPKPNFISNTLEDLLYRWETSDCLQLLIYWVAKWLGKRIRKVFSGEIHTSLYDLRFCIYHCPWSSFIAH